ncbi:hypothetical protein GX50_03085 [[Emmonsia] crescens]|uniref:Uncharacterized protein n=1 Tax=[Emmonsia] crescens TaxID=73230 RepID=A0A2B7ZM86_9EURO|nr:hypothetical protein GX50_03085 [Emmonsia crescens]
MARSSMPLRDNPRAMKKLGRLPGVWVDGTILRISGATNEMAVPLCVVLRKQEPGDLGMARYEIPQLLLQANMVFNYDQNFERYDVFLITA